MKVTTIKNSLWAVALLGATLTVSAAHADPPKNINSRQHEQQKRIVQGRKSGQLTREEAWRLQWREAELRRREAHYRATGHKMTTDERLRLERDLDRQSKTIYAQKHDTQHRHH